MQGIRRESVRGALMLSLDVFLASLGLLLIGVNLAAASTGEYIVAFRDGQGLDRQNQALRQASVPTGQKIGLINAQVVETTAADARTLAEDTGVRYVERSRANIRVTQLPNDPFEDSNQWNLYAAYGVNAENAWDAQTGSGIVVIAVVDTGIDYNHPDLQGNMWRNPGESGAGREANGVDDDGDGYVDDVYGINAITGSGNPMDDNDHGSHVSGIIGAVGNNGVGITGVNWRTQLMATKFINSDGNGTNADAVEGINYAVTHGAKIINASFAGGYSQAMRDAIHAAGDAGVLVVAAAGNGAGDSGGNNNDSSPTYPASYDEPNIITVASTTDEGELSSFSNYGPGSVDIAAPGSAIYSTIRGNAYGYKSGTSMAAPHITGVAGLLLSTNPGMNVDNLKTSILGSVRPLPSLQGRIATGGLLNAGAALNSPGDASKQTETLLVNRGKRYTNTARIQGRVSNNTRWQSLQVNAIAKNNVGLNAWGGSNTSSLFNLVLQNVDGAQVVQAQLLRGQVAVGRSNAVRVMLDRRAPSRFRVRRPRVRRRSIRLVWTKARDKVSGVNRYEVRLFRRDKWGKQRLARKRTKKTHLVLRQTLRPRRRYFAQICAIDRATNKRCKNSPSFPKKH